MEFAEFAQKIKPILGDSYSTSTFVKTLFEEIITEEGRLHIEDVSPETFKAYYNGSTGITRIAKRISRYTDPEQFVAGLNTVEEATTVRLAKLFKNDIEDINPYNANEKIAYYFEDILFTAAAKKRRKIKKIEGSTPSKKISGKTLPINQTFANSKDNPSKPSNEFANSAQIVTESIKLPPEHPSETLPYSSPDQALLKEFTSDYDEIMLTLIGADYATALLDMSIPSKIELLYSNKWRSKADNFCSPTLKSYVFGLLGELKLLSDSFFSDSAPSPSIPQIMLKIRNLYVRLHPDAFSRDFPYEASIDDWNDGEF